MKKKIYHYLEPTENSSKKEKLLIIFIVFLILLNSIVVIIETVDWIFSPLRIYFEIFEYFSITVFSIELILRIWKQMKAHCLPDNFYNLEYEDFLNKRRKLISDYIRETFHATVGVLAKRHQQILLLVVGDIQTKYELNTNNGGKSSTSGRAKNIILSY